MWTITKSLTEVVNQLEAEPDVSFLDRLIFAAKHLDDPAEENVVEKRTVATKDTD